MFSNSKMAAGGHIGKISITVFQASVEGFGKCDTWNRGLSMQVISFLVLNLWFEFKFKMAAGGHIGWTKKEGFCFCHSNSLL